jgi:beta-lactamase class A
LNRTGRLEVVALAVAIVCTTASHLPAAERRTHRAQPVTVQELARVPVSDAQVIIRNAVPDSALSDLATEIEVYAARAGGSVGFAVRHLETGVELSLRGHERFPMASVYKIPIALTLLDRVACDAVSLDDSVPITAADLRTGSGFIYRHHRHIKALSVRDLLEAMLTESDNTASDLLMRVCGGPEVVNAHMQSLGVRGVRVDRYEALMSLHYSGVSEIPPDSMWTMSALWRLKQEVPLERRAESAEAFLEDPRDTATPLAMVDLLARVWRHEALGPDETSRLLEILKRIRTGSDRIPRFLPEGTPVAHKTGTWTTAFGITAAVNDVGIVTLPDGTHVAIAVFVKGSNRGPRRIERTIAALALAVYDHWAL